jgi:CBS domain-containing protein
VDWGKISSDNLSAMPRYRISDLMNSDVVSARPGMTVAEVRDLLASREISGAPVVDESGKILGVVSLSDLARYISSQRTTVGESGQFFSNLNEYRELANLPRNASDVPVESLMSKEAYTIAQDSSAAAGAKLMRERKIHRLLVTEEGLLVGVVTALDLLRVVEET